MPSWMLASDPRWEQVREESRIVYEYRKLVDDITEIIEEGDDKHGGYHVRLEDWEEVAALLHQPNKSRVYYAIEDAIKRTRHSDVMLRCFIEALEKLYPEKPVKPKEEE